MLLTSLQQQRILLLGPPDTGKTSLVTRLVDKKFQECSLATVGVDFSGYVAQIDGYGGSELGLQIWDLGGDIERRIPFRVETNDAIMFCFDASQPESLKQLEKWMALVLKNTTNCCKLVVATKCDKLSSPLQHSQLDSINKSLTQKGYDFIRTSAKTGMNVEAGFLYLARQIAHKRQDSDGDLPLRLFSRRRLWTCCSV